MSHENFAQGIFTLVGRSRLFDHRHLEVVLIINPRAGGFSHASRYRQALLDIQAAVLETEALGGPATALRTRVLETRESRHASRMADDLIAEAAQAPQQHYLVILACGDGTSLEFLDNLSRSDEQFRRRFCVLRLPMGTGNDGSDGRKLPESLSRLTGNGRIDSQAAIRVIPHEGGPASQRAPQGYWSAFNIASLGLDAFVTHRTNQLKSKLPGNSYKLWVDIASILYDKIYPVQKMTISADHYAYSGGDSSTVEGEFLLCAMGVSGRRCYGAHKPILPDDDNVCAIRQMPLLRKLQLKNPITKGLHRRFPEAVFLTADRLKFEYQGKLLVQMDGEAEELSAADFPLLMQRTEPLVRHIASLADIPVQSRQTKDKR